MGIPVGIAPSALQQFFDVDGNPFAGGLLYTYASGTTTPLATYADFGGNTQNPNPLVLDSGGFASPGLFLQALAYTFSLTDANNIPQWSQDGIVSDQAIQNLKSPTAQVFLVAGSGSFTVPTNVSAVKVTVVGGGGAGGGATTTNNGTGGGSGSSGISWLTGLTPGDALTLTIGAGGVPVSASTGGTGGSSIVTGTFGTITAPGGVGGTLGTLGASGGAMGTGATLNFGGNASSNTVAQATANSGGAGAGSIFGGGGPAPFNNPGIVGSAPGAGGSGAGGGSNRSGGAGVDGCVIFEYLQ